MSFLHYDHFTQVAAVLIGVLSVARTARLITYDDFPPMAWARLRLITATGNGKWSQLFLCSFCIAPYLSVGQFAWAYFSDTNTAWWIINGVWAASYLAAIAVSYDESS